MKGLAMLQLSESFKSQIRNTYGIPGNIWLQQLPKIINYAVDKWQLKNTSVVNPLSYNYVIYGFSKVFNMHIVLKIMLESSEFHHEKLALLYFHGFGINKLITIPQ